MIKIHKKTIAKRNDFGNYWQYEFASGKRGWKYLAYYKKKLFEEPNEINVFHRSDHRNYRIMPTTAAIKKGYPRFLFLNNFYKRDKKFRKEKAFWIKSYTNSFNRFSTFLYKDKRFLKYQKNAPDRYATSFSLRSSWSSKMYLEEILKLKKIRRKFLENLYEKKLTTLGYSKDGKNLDPLLRAKRLGKQYMFTFLPGLSTMKSSSLKKFTFFQSSKSLENRENFIWKIKRDNTLRYRPLRRRSYIVASTSKIWKRIVEKPIRRYLGNKSIGDMKYLAKKTKKDLFSKNTSGFKMRQDSRVEYMITSIIHKLKIAPSQFIASKFVRSGLVTVNNKVFNNPNARVKTYDVIKYKGSFFRNYLLTVLHQEDRFFEKFPTKSPEKGSTFFLSRFWPPSYLEINFKLQEAIILRNSLLYEQSAPYVMKRSNIPIFLKTHFEKKGAGLF